MFGDILVDKQSLFCDHIQASTVTALPLGFLLSGVSVEFLVLFSVCFKHDGCVLLKETIFCSCRLQHTGVCAFPKHSP